MNITINAGKNAIDIKSITVGSFGSGIIEGSTKLTLTGDLTAEDAASFKIGNIWGGSGSDTYNKETGVYTGSVEGERILSFEGFKGVLSASIGDFSRVTADKDSRVELTSAAHALSYANNWDIEFAGAGETSFAGEFTNNMLNDTLTLTGVELAANESWTVFGQGVTLEGIEKLSVIINGADATFDNVNAWTTADYKLSYTADTGMILTKSTIA